MRRGCRRRRAWPPPRYQRHHRHCPCQHSPYQELSLPDDPASAERWPDLRVPCPAATSSQSNVIADPAFRPCQECDAGGGPEWGDCERLQKEVRLMSTLTRKESRPFLDLFD